MERRQIESFGDRRAGRERHHHADHHQRAERAEQPAIDGAKPIGDGTALRSGHHDRLLLGLAAGSASRAAAIRADDEVAETIAARFEIGELIVGGAGRRQQHHRLRRRAERRVARRGAKRVLQRAASLEGHFVAERAREFVARRADQIGLGDAREQRAQRLDAALLGLAAENPKDVAERQQRLLGGVGVGGLGVVDEQNPPLPPHLLHAVGEAGERGEPARDLLGAEAQRARRGEGEGRVLAVVRAAQRRRDTQIDELSRSCRARR